MITLIAIMMFMLVPVSSLTIIAEKIIKRAIIITFGIMKMTLTAATMLLMIIMVTVIDTGCDSRKIRKLQPVDNGGHTDTDADIDMLILTLYS